MNLKFFADHCVSNFVVRTLQDLGCLVFKLRDRMPTNSPDQQVILKAQELDSILISLNGDFTNIITYPPGDYKGIVALQIKNHPEITLQIMKRLKEYLLANPKMEHYKGKLFLVEVHRIRIWAQ